MGTTEHLVRTKAELPSPDIVAGIEYPRAWACPTRRQLYDRAAETASNLDQPAVARV